MLDMNLQLFSEDTETEEQATEVKTYTEEELNAKLQAEADRRVTKALQTAKEKWEQEQAVKIEQEKELAKLSEEEKAKKQLDMERQSLEKERLEFKKIKLELETTKILDERKLPTKFAKYLIADDNEQTLANINEFQENWQQAIQSEIESRLKGKTPQKNGETGVAGVTKEQFKKMGYTQRLELKNSNPELYNQLLGG